MISRPNLKQYYEKAETWDQEIFANIRQSRNRAWLMSAFSMILAILSVLALILLLPLKTFAPYVVTVDKSTGYVEITQGLAQGNLTQDDAITQSNLVRYLVARESYNPSILRENYDFVALMSAGSALKDYQSLWNGKNPENPSVKLGRSASIDIKIQSVSFLNGKTASVRFLREQKDNEQTKSGSWTAIIDFQYSQKPMRMADRFSNPLGFQVTSYRVNPEIMENIK